MDDDGDTFTVMGMRFAWMRFAYVCAPSTSAPFVEFLLQLARQRRTSCTPPPLPRLAESCRLVAFGWRPVLVPELLRDERRVWCGEFAYELRFIVDVLV